MDFQYSDAPQRSPEWFDIRLGKVSASRLVDWLAVSKAAKTKGAPLKPRLDYEKELMFERQFHTSFETYVTGAMQDGIDFEQFAADQYQQLHPEYLVYEVGCWYNDCFVASPDRTVAPKRINNSDLDNSIGLLEIKIVKDNSFTDVLINGVPDKHWKQIQGQLWASGAEWCDYMALNFNTKKFVVIRVEPDAEFHEYLAESVQEQLVVDTFKEDAVYDIVGEIPEIQFNETALEGGSW